MTDSDPAPLPSLSPSGTSTLLAADEEQPLRLHILANVLVPTHPLFTWDHTTVRVVNLARLFTEKGHHVMFYGVDGMEDYVECSEYVPVVNSKIYKEVIIQTRNFTDPRYFVNYEPYQALKTNLYQKFGEGLAEAFRQRYRPGDLIIHTFDTYEAQAMGNPKHHISINGDGKSYTANVIYETESWRAYHSANNLAAVPIERSTVIMPFFNRNDWTFHPEDKDQPVYLFLNRIAIDTGAEFFLQLSQRYPEATFWLAGGCVAYNEKNQLLTIAGKEEAISLDKYPNVVYYGQVMPELRRELLSKAWALLQPTYYFDPCSWNVIEALFSGTPVLVPQSGGFLDLVPEASATSDAAGNNKKQPLVGYRCQPNDWVTKMAELDRIKPADCRQYALTTFSEERAYKQYLAFFQQVLAGDKSV